MKINLKSTKLLNIIIFLMCLIAVTTAVQIQIFYKLNPCAICILARYVIIAIGLLNFISIFISKPIITKILRDFSFLLTAFGMGYSLRHIYIVQQKIDSCKIDKLQAIINNSPLSRLFPTLFESTGSCLDANFVFMGISFTLLTFVFYIFILLLSFWFAVKQKNI